MRANDEVTSTGRPSLAEATIDRLPDIAEELLAEMDRAMVVPVATISPKVVQMGSTVKYVSDGHERRVTLVYPGEADIGTGRISILTPVGAALIGLSEGQSIAWSARDGQPRELTVLAVTAPGAAA